MFFLPTIHNRWVNDKPGVFEFLEIAGYRDGKRGYFMHVWMPESGYLAFVNI